MDISETTLFIVSNTDKDTTEAYLELYRTSIMVFLAKTVTGFNSYLLSQKSPSQMFSYWDGPDRKHSFCFYI